MKKILLSITICLFTIESFAQITILPNDKIINKSLFKFGITAMDYSIQSNGNISLVGKYEIAINYDNKALEVYTSLTKNDGGFPELKHTVSDANTLKPISLESLNIDSRLELKFSDEITGFQQGSGSKTKTSINEKMKEGYFDINTIPYILPALPLKENFKAKIPVYNYYANNENEKFTAVTIIDVQTDIHYATYTGNHNVWRAVIFDNTTQKSTSYFIDKVTGKFWKILYSDHNGDLHVFTNNESDYNPLKNKFDKEATLNLVTKGNAVIKGQAFARDNKNSISVLGAKVVNTDKKQFAEKGTKIILTPYTPYFEEWNKANEPKKNSVYTPPTLPLPKGAELCVIETTVMDDEGHFEFSQLMPSKYLITTAFEFSHAASTTTVIGYNDYFTNGYYTGSNVVTNTEHYNMNINAKVKKIVEISKEGEIVILKLKKSF